MRPHHEICARVAIRDYIDLVGSIGLGYHPDTDPAEYGYWESSVRFVRARLEEHAPSVDEYELSVRALGLIQ